MSSHTSGHSPGHPGSTSPSAARAAVAATFERVLPRLLGQEGALPDDWDIRATTYDLPRFDSEDRFAARLVGALEQIAADEVSEPGRLRELLYACGLPYDYARLGQPLSTVYEVYLQAKTGAARVFTFASVTKPWLSVIEAPGRVLPVHVYAESALPVSEGLRASLARRGATLHEHHRGPVGPLSGALSVLVCDRRFEGPIPADLDAVCYPVPHGGVLLVRDAARIEPRGVQLIRKRTVAALLAADARDELLRIAGLAPPPLPEATAETCHDRLRALFPQITDTLIFCTGLAAEAAVFTAACDVLGPAPVTLFYAANGYGGTGQLLSEVLPGATQIAPVPVPVFGADAAGRPLTLVDGVVARLEAQRGPACIFLETPTNPELQVHDFAKLMGAVRAYHQRTGHRVPILVDTTLAPLYPIFAMDFAQGWPFLLVKSGSKYFTKGKSTLGVAAIAGDPLAKAILDRAKELGRDADSFAKPTQLHDLAEGLSDLPARMQRIAANTAELADGLRRALGARGHELVLYSISREHAARGLACGLLSFYLPPAPTDHADLVDEFVDEMLARAPKLVKSRVSYGQSTGGGALDWFYVINPQESTQGSLPEAVKNAQKRNNVQLCRISVPEHADVAGLLAAMEGFFDRKYGTPS